LATQYFAKKSIDKLIADSERPGQQLKKSLGPWSLTALGIGAIIGSGIFALTGTAAAGEHGDPSFYKAQVLDLFLHLLHTGSLSGIVMYGRPPAGPAIAISFLLVALACAFAGLCYAELASMIPIAGSAYTYSYATLGELVAWIIGWDLILEYAVSNVAVAVSFGGYFKEQLASFHIYLPDKWSTPVWTPDGWSHSYFNFPAFLIVFILTVLLVRGVRESAEANNVIVLIKIGAILLFLFVGGMLVHPANWHPFAPSGFPGIMAGGAIIFFSYIGFDSVSTAAEEAHNAQRDIPFGIIASLIVCTILYIGVAIVLLGMVPYSAFTSGAAKDASVIFALKQLGANPIFQAVIVIGALMGMISSLLVFQYGQTRIWFAMSRDGLLPKFFSSLHTTFKTPHWSTWIAGLLVGVPAGIVDIGQAADLSNIGTLFAFVLVSLGVIFLRRKQPDRQRGFRVPFVPFFPLISIVLCIGLMSGLLVITWVRFFVWLLIGLVIFFSWSRYWSEFSDPAFRRLVDEESQVRAAMTPTQEQVFQSQRKRPGVAWFLTLLFGMFGAHLYYVGRAARGILRTVGGCLAILLTIVYFATRSHAALDLLLGLGAVLALFAFIELMTIVRQTQELNVLTARGVSESIKASV
jgi:basic amino acid/polyamine antiporter, APA family